MIDTHAHVFHRGLRFSPQRRYTPTYDAWPQDYLRLLEQYHVSHGVLVPVSILGTDNSFVIETVRASLGRLKGLVTLDPMRGAAQVGEFASAGMSGFRLNLAGQPLVDLQSGEWPEILRESARHGWIADVNDSAARLPHTVPPLLDAGLRVVLDHFGQPDQSAGIADPGFHYVLSLAVTKRVWVKLSAPYRFGSVHAPAAASALLRAYGAAHLLWASDWPFTGFESAGIDYANARDYLKEWVLDEDDREQIAHRSAAALFGFATAGVTG